MAIENYKPLEESEDLPDMGNSPMAYLYACADNCARLNHEREILFDWKESIRPVLRQRFIDTLAKLDWITQKEGIPEKYQKIYRYISKKYNEIKGDEPLSILVKLG